jgi:hypothetical protein
MKTFKVEFVEFIPDVIQDETLYISMKYKAARHRCACGCRSIIITPISPNHWKIYYDGKGVSLTPSIGNWSFRCRSHYWIVGNEVQWEGEDFEKGISNINQTPDLRPGSLVARWIKGLKKLILSIFQFSD